MNKVSPEFKHSDEGGKTSHGRKRRPHPNFNRSLVFDALEERTHLSAGGVVPDFSPALPDDVSHPSQELRSEPQQTAASNVTATTRKVVVDACGIIETTSLGDMTLDQTKAFLTSQIDATNTVLEKSNLQNVSFNLVNTFEIEVPHMEQAVNIADFTDQIGSSELFLKERLRYACDVYLVLVSSERISQTLVPGHTDMPDNTIPREEWRDHYVAAVNTIDVIANPAYNVIPHELGHAIGAWHQDDSLTAEQRASKPFPEAGAYVYQVPGTSQVIASLDATQGALPDDVNVTYIPQYSSPDLTWTLHVGTQTITKTLGDAQTADNGSAIRKMAPIVEGNESVIHKTLVTVAPGPVDLKMETAEQRPNAIAAGSWTVAEGTLPRGLSLDPVTGRIVGVIGINQTVSVTIAGTDVVSGGSHTGQLVLQSSDAVSEWQNPANHADVSGDGNVTALDALLSINVINEGGGSRALLPGIDLVPPYYDVDGNGSITPTDILITINIINNQAPLAAGESGTPSVAHDNPDLTLNSTYYVASQPLVTTVSHPAPAAEMVTGSDAAAVDVVLTRRAAAADDQEINPLEDDVLDAISL